MSEQSCQRYCWTTDFGLGFNVNADGKPDVRPKFCFISFEKYRLGLNSSPSSSNTAISSSRLTKHYILFAKEFFCFEFREISIRMSFMEAFPKIIHCFFETAIFFKL